MSIIKPAKARLRVRTRPPISQGKSQIADAKVEAVVRATGVQRALPARHMTIPPATEEPTLAEALARYEREITAYKSGRKQERRRIVAWSRSELAGAKLSRLNSSHFALYMHERIRAGIACSTARRDLALISHLFAIARTAWGLPQLVNPITGMRLPRPNMPRHRLLSREEFVRFESALDSSPNRLMQINVRFALETAARKDLPAGRHHSPPESRTATT